MASGVQLADWTSMSTKMRLVSFGLRRRQRGSRRRSGRPEKLVVADILVLELAFHLGILLLCFYI